MYYLFIYSKAIISYIPLFVTTQRYFKSNFNQKLQALYDWIMFLWFLGEAPYVLLYIFEKRYWS